MENLLPAVSARLITSGSVATIFLALLDVASEVLLVAISLSCKRLHQTSLVGQNFVGIEGKEGNSCRLQGDVEQE
ncbi:hypothetical protein Tco_1269582 [Tanacetum coccineum]